MAHRDIPNIDTLGEAGDITAPLGSREWAIAVRGELSICLSDEASNRGRIKHLTGLLQESRGYERLSDSRGKAFTSWRSFCVAPAPWGLKYDPDLIDAIVDEGEKLTAQERIVIAAMETNTDSVPIKQGQRTDIANLVMSPREDRASQAGVSRDTQRKLDYLARKRPELLTAVRNKEIKTDAAYRMARGKSRMVAVPVDDVRAIARALVRHLTVDQIEELTSILAGDK